MAVWNKILDYGKQVLALTRTVDQHTDEIKQLRAEMTQLRQEFRDVMIAVREMRNEQILDRETATRDREILLLRLENTLLRHGQSLPSPAPASETEPGADRDLQERV